MKTTTRIFKFGEWHIDLNYVTVIKSVRAESRNGTVNYIIPWDDISGKGEYSRSDPNLEKAKLIREKFVNAWIEYHSQKEGIEKERVEKIDNIIAQHASTPVDPIESLEVEAK